MNEAVAATLRAERAVTQWTLKELVRRSGVPERTLVRILNAERAINTDQISDLAHAFGLSASHIMLEAERRLASSPNVDPFTPADAVTLDQLAAAVAPKGAKATQRNKRSGGAGS